MSWVKRAAGAVLAWAVLLGYGFLAGRDPRPLLLAAVVAGAAMIVWLVLDVWGWAAPAIWRLAPRFRTPHRSFDQRFSRLAQQLVDAADRDAVAAEVHRSLAEISDDLLRNEYGTDLDQAESARRILGDPLMDYLDAPPRYPRRGYHQQISQHLDRLESL
ncbi:MAG: hypothetical protein ACRDQA_10005 [Nocardioidaceae bacterium]